MSRAARSTYRKPNLEFYRNKARKLVKLHRDCEPKALSQIKYNHDRFIQLTPADIAEHKFLMRDAQTVIARIDGYKDWAQLKQHVQVLNGDRNNESLLFEKAAEAVVQGHYEVLERLLDQHPELVHTSSSRDHGCMLLHYIAANGIEHHRQKTPANAVAIAELLLQRGAKADALANTYGGGTAQTTLNLLVSSGWPHAAGLQGDLVQMLCKYGAQPDGLNRDGLPLATALVFFYGDTAKALANAGASTDNLLAAATIGTPKDVDACFTKAGRLRKGNFVYIGFELRAPRIRLEMFGQAFAYAAMCGNLPTMKRLHNQHDCPVDVAADRGIRALHLAAYMGHAKVVQWLIGKGADGLLRDNQWNSTPVAWAWQTGRRKIRDQIIDSVNLDLHSAVSFFRLGDVKRLLKSDRKADLADSGDGSTNAVNQRNSEGLLPIHCLHDDTQDGQEIIECLVRAGADVNALDPDGRTSIDRLRAHGRRDLIQILKRLGGKTASELTNKTV